MPVLWKLFSENQKKKMQEHVSVCAGQVGFSYSFDNGKIINFQDNFKKIGDLPFSIYYDFETTAGSAVFFWCKNVCDKLLYDCGFSSWFELTTYAYLSSIRLNRSCAWINESFFSSSKIFF